MIDTNKLRQLAQGVNEHSDDRAEILAEFYAATQSDTIIELLDRLEAAEKSDAESLMMYRKARDERDALRAKIAEMERQEPTGEWWNCLIADISAVDCAYPGSPTYVHDAYWMRDRVVQILEKRRDSLPGTQGVPKEAIAKILTEVMDIATSNGADSRSMPDEYVEVAAWLCGIPAQAAPSVPEGFSREDLEAVADGLDGYEKTVNVGNVTGGGDDHLESTTAYAARFIRAMLAAPETKP